jgi:hypothetical protein
MDLFSKALAAGASLAALAALAAAPAHATTIFVGPAASTTTFGHASPGVLGKTSFTDTFGFTLTHAGDISGTISSPYNQIKLGKKTLTQNLVFTTVKLDTTAWTFTTNGAGLSASGGMAEEPIAPGFHTLTISGKNLGNTMSNYTAVLNFLPVPEPATWAMVITGIGMLGVAARRRRQLGATPA